MRAVEEAAEHPEYLEFGRSSSASKSSASKSSAFRRGRSRRAGGSSRFERLITGARIPARGSTNAKIHGPVQSKSFGLADRSETSARCLGGDNCGRRPSPEDGRA